MSSEQPPQEPELPQYCSFCKRHRLKAAVLFINPTVDTAVCDNCVMILTNRLHTLTCVTMSAGGTKH